MSVKATDLPLISVIAPSYNQGQFIETAIESILSQKYPSFECIAIDAGSTDETHSILEGYRNRVKIVNAPGLKQSRVLNQGLALSHGDIIGFLNADDHYSEDTFSIVAKHFLERQDTDVIYGDFHIIDETGKRLLTHRELGFHHPSYLFLGQFISYPTVFLRRRAYLRVGEFDPSLDFAMDYDYWLRIARHGKIEHIPKLLASFRWHPNSKGVLYERNAREECRAVRKRYLEREGQISDSLLGFLYRAFFWVVYKVRRVFLKLIQGKYWTSLPQPIAFYLWKRRLKYLQNQVSGGIQL